MHVLHCEPCVSFVPFVVHFTTTQRQKGNLWTMCVQFLAKPNRVVPHCAVADCPFGVVVPPEQETEE